MEKTLFYDIEVFKHDALVIFKDSNKNTVAEFHNNFLGLHDVIQDKTLVSYNGYFYDDIILHKMLEGWSVPQLKQLNDAIIHGTERQRVRFYKFRSLDCFQQIDVSMPSLKKLEANMSKTILESSVSFDIEAPLSPEQLEEVKKYCSYDVDTLIDVYKMRIDTYFKPKEMLVQMVNKPNCERWNTTTLSANALVEKPVLKWYQIRIPEEWVGIVPDEVFDMWLEKDKGKIVIEDMENEITFGFGGIHGNHIKKKYFENVHLLDVASLYPSLIINHNVLGAATEKYKEILDERLRIKHTDPDRQAALKLILNSVYGLLKSEYSTLYNPKASTTICALGQICLYDLAKRLYSVGCEIVQLNTDGVAFIPSNDEYKRIWTEWEQDYNLTLEEDIFTKLWQRDVNNYVGVTPSGKMKTKGGDVNRYKEPAIFKNNSMRILDICLVEYLTKKTDPLTTILSHLEEPELFMLVLQAGNTFLGTYDAENRSYQKINRVFASKEGVCLYKKRKDGALVKFPDAPETMHIFNRDLKEFTNFAEIVDINFYYQLAMKRINRWK